MLFRNFSKLLLPVILCIFTQASSMLNDQEMLVLEKFGQTLLERNNGENAETNAQLRGFIKNLPLFMQENLPQTMQKLDKRGTLTLENVIRSCVDSLIAKLRLNKQDSASCRAFVAESLEKTTQFQDAEICEGEKACESKGGFISAPFSIAKTLMFAFVFCLCITTGNGALIYCPQCPNAAPGQQYVETGPYTPQFPSANNPYPTYDPMKNQYTDPYSGKPIR